MSDGTFRVDRAVLEIHHAVTAGRAKPQVTGPVGRRAVTTASVGALRTIDACELSRWLTTRRQPPPARVLETIAEALTIQVERDFAPAWGVPTTQFKVGGRGNKIHFFDSAHQAGDFGWHIVDGYGLP